MIVAAVDVGALVRGELVTLDLGAEGDWLLSVSGRATDNVETPVASSDHVAFGPPGAALAGHDTPVWLEPGRYGVRNAGLSSAPPDRRTWSMVIDGSVSAQKRWEAGDLATLVHAAAGCVVEWTRHWPVLACVQGVDLVEASDVSDPDALLTAALSDQDELATWSMFVSPVRAAADRMGPGGTVLVVSDGVPGDAPELLELLDARPTLRLILVVSGRSQCSVPSDGPVSAVEDELPGLRILNAHARVTAVSVSLRDEEPRLSAEQCQGMAKAIGAQDVLA